MSIMRMNLMRGFVSMNLIPSGVRSLGASLINDPIYSTDLNN